MRKCWRGRLKSTTCHSSSLWIFHSMWWSFALPLYCEKAGLVCWHYACGTGHLGKVSQALSRFTHTHTLPFCTFGGLMNRCGRHSVPGGSCYFRAGGSAPWGSKPLRLWGLHRCRGPLISGWSFYPPADQAAPSDRNLCNYLSVWWWRVGRWEQPPQNKRENKRSGLAFQSP